MWIIATTTVHEASVAGRAQHKIKRRQCRASKPPAEPELGPKTVLSAEMDVGRARLGHTGQLYELATPARKLGNRRISRESRNATARIAARQARGLRRADAAARTVSRRSDAAAPFSAFEPALPQPALHRESTPVDGVNRLPKTHRPGAWSVCRIARWWIIYLSAQSRLAVLGDIWRSGARERPPDFEAYRAQRIGAADPATRYSRLCPARHGRRRTVGRLALLGRKTTS